MIVLAHLVRLNTNNSTAAFLYLTALWPGHDKLAVKNCFSAVKVEFACQMTRTFFKNPAIIETPLTVGHDTVDVPHNPTRIKGGVASFIMPKCTLYFSVHF